MSELEVGCIISSDPFDPNRGQKRKKICTTYMPLHAWARMGACGFIWVRLGATASHDITVVSFNLVKEIMPYFSGIWAKIDISTVL